MSCTVDQTFHDAELKGIDNGRVGRVVLLFHTADHQNKSVTLSGCDFFRVNDFVSQNVVSRLLVFRGVDIEVPAVAERLRWATSLSDASSFLSEEKLSEVITKIQKSERGLLVVEPSWGAELVVLFEDMH
jgi:Tfp pilus assembly ATPase PilU